MNSEETTIDEKLLLTPDDRSCLTSIVIPCYILPDKDAELLTFLRRCLESIRRHTEDYELILVDNGSPIGGDYMRGTADIYVRNQENLGYAVAVNQGVKLARGEWLVVMNDDVEVMDGWLETMQAAWGPRTGAVSSHLHDADPEHRVGREYYNIPMGHMFGALWMTQPEVLAKVGLLDEGYERGMFEDKDLWMRLVKTGYVLGKAGWCKHIGNATWGKLPNQQEIYLRNKARFEARWGKL